VDVVGVDRVERVDHRGPAGDRTVTHDVVVRSARLPGTPVADDPRLPAWGDRTVRWVRTVPSDAYRDHPETVTDIERLLE